MAGLIKINKDALEAAKRIDAIVAEYQDLIKGVGENEQVSVMVAAMDAIRTCINQAAMSELRRLSNTDKGFLTDRPNDKPYSDDIIKECYITALLRGLRRTNNEFNIIAGKCYEAKNGIRRKLLEVHGFRDLKLELGYPKTADGGCLVSAKATWLMNGEIGELICEGDYRIPIRRNEGMGVDAVLGKAEVKLYKRIYAIVTGQIMEDEPEVAMPLLESGQAGIRIETTRVQPDETLATETEVLTKAEMEAALERESIQSE